MSLSTQLKTAVSQTMTAPLPALAYQVSKANSVKSLLVTLALRSTIVTPLIQTLTSVMLIMITEENVLVLVIVLKGMIWTVLSGVHYVMVTVDSTRCNVMLKMVLLFACVNLAGRDLYVSKLLGLMKVGYVYGA